MDNNLILNEIRRNNLESKMKEVGSMVAFSEAVDKPPALFSQIRTSSRNMGEKLAREIESTLFLPNGWFDIEHDGEKSVLEESISNIRKAFQQQELDETEKKLITLFRKLSKKEKSIIIEMAKLHAKKT